MENQERPNFYAVIPANVRYANITPNAKLLYGEITALSTQKGYCFARNKYFANLYGVSIVSISKWIKELIDNNFIESEIIYKEGTKEILNRYLRIIGEGIKEKFNTPIKERFKDNNTNINNTNNNIKKENKKEKKELDLSFCNSQFIELIIKWLKYKKEKKQSYTQMGIEMFYKKLLTLSNNNLSVASEIINNSIANNYAGIFELKNNKSSNYNYCSQQDCPY